MYNRFIIWKFISCHDAEMNQNKAFRWGVDITWERFQQVSHILYQVQMQLKDSTPVTKLLKHNTHQFNNCLCTTFYAWSMIQTFRNRWKMYSFVTVIKEIFPVCLLIWRLETNFSSPNAIWLILLTIKRNWNWSEMHCL